MVKKTCLFCDEIVPIEPKGDLDKYVGCQCSPNGFYSLLRESYDSIYSISYQRKRKIFPIISAYIRELTDSDEPVEIAFEDIDTIENSPRIPVAIEEKGMRLLQYLYRHSEEPEQSVLIHPLAANYNLTYSPNLQEFVYIIEKLREEQSIIRDGMSLVLTEKGRSEAAARAGGRKLKACFVLLSDNEEIRSDWTEKVLPKIEQCGYFPRLFNPYGKGNIDNPSIELLSESKLIIADLTNHATEVYFAAGYGLGMGIPVTWTIKRSHLDKLTVKSHQLRPLIWDTAEELADIFQQRLS